MATGKYQLKKPESGSGVPGSHELKGGKVVKYGQPQTFDPDLEGIADYCELVESAKPVKPATLPA